MKLFKLLKKHSGRSGGKVTVRHQGGRSKRFLRVIDFKRSIKDVWAKVESIEYDPNRNARIAKIVYANGLRSYIISPVGLKSGSKVIASSEAPLEPGNCLPLSKIPVGLAVHNIEIKPNAGGQIARGAGIAAFVFGKDEKSVLIKMPSGEVRRFDPSCWATIGQVGNVEDKNKRRTKAGASRWRGIRPTVRGVAMHPNAHQHGGGEGRTAAGMHPVSPWGIKTKGYRTRKNKRTNSMIVQRRHKR